MLQFSVYIPRINLEDRDYILAARTQENETGMRAWALLKGSSWLWAAGENRGLEKRQSLQLAGELS